MAVDPDNRTVARTLEAQWETSLRELEDVRHRYEAEQEARGLRLSDADRSKIRSLARDLPAVWHAPTTSQADRKAMLRIAIEAVALRPIDVPKRLTHIEVQWRSGAVDELTTERLAYRATSTEVVERIRQLAAEGLHDEDIAGRLNSELIPTATNGRWSLSTVKAVRLNHLIARTAPSRPNGRLHIPHRHPDGRFSIRGAIARFGVSDARVRQWIRQGLIPAVREDFQQHRNVWWLTIDDATAQRIEQRRRAGTKTSS